MNGRERTGGADGKGDVKKNKQENRMEGIDTGDGFSSVRMTAKKKRKEKWRHTEWPTRINRSKMRERRGKECEEMW